MLQITLGETDGAWDRTLSVDLDPDGLQDLITQLLLLRDGRSDHVHFFSEAWGGVGEVQADPEAPERAVHHLKITLARGS